MNIYKIIQSQYLAGLEMLKEIIENCPDEFWNAKKDRNKTWQVAFHSLFFVHLYLQPKHADFKPFADTDISHRTMDEPEEGAEPYARAELLGYLAFCKQQVLEIVPALDLHGESGFEWLQFSTLELQFYSIRHLMQHTGELMERMWVDAEIEGRWVGSQPVGGNEGE